MKKWKKTFQTIAFLGMPCIANPLSFGRNFTDLSVGPKIAENFSSLEVSIYDMQLWNPRSGGRDPYKFAFALEAPLYSRGVNKRFGFGAEYFFFSKPNDWKNLSVNYLIPNPQIMVYQYSDGDYGFAGTIFFMWIVMPYFEWDFKLKEFTPGMMVKVPVLAFLNK